MNTDYQDIKIYGKLLSEDIRENLRPIQPVVHCFAHCMKKIRTYNPKEGERHFIPLPQSLPPREGRNNSSPLTGEVRVGVN
jgi:hypothetical protein